MTKLPIISGRECVKALGKIGFYFDILVEFEEVPDFFTYIEIEEFLSRKLNVNQRDTSTKKILKIVKN